MNPSHVPLPSNISTNNLTDQPFCFRSFFKKAWQKSLNLAQSLIQFTAHHSSSLKNLSAQSNQSMIPKDHQKKSNQDDPMRSIFLKKDQKPSNIETNNSSRSHSLSSLIDQKVSDSSQKISQNQPLYFGNKRNQQVKIFVIPDQRGRINVKQVLKKLKDQKQQKIQKQKLKISRSQFKFFQSVSTDEKLEGKSLMQIFKPKSLEPINEQKYQEKTQKRMKNDKQNQEKTPQKGRSQFKEQKMTNESSPSIVFRQDLSTILQSSNEDVLQDKKVQKAYFLCQQINKKQVNQEHLQKVNKISQDERKKSNPFLEGMKGTSNINLSNEVKKNSVIQSMRMKLFNSPLELKQGNSVQILTTTNNINIAPNVNNIFGVQKIFNSEVPNINNNLNRNQKLKLVSPQPYNHHTNKLNHFQTSFGSQYLHANDQKQTRGSSSNQYHEFLTPKPSQNYTQMKIPSFPIQQKYTLHQEDTAKHQPSSVNIFSNPVNFNTNNELLENQRNKKIFNSFLQPSNTNFTNSNPSHQSLSLFGSKVERQVQIGGQRKTEKKSRVQVKKRNKKEQRIRG